MLETLLNGAAFRRYVLIPSVIAVWAEKRVDAEALEREQRGTGLTQWASKLFDLWW
jgi:hypothetical protein